jgi:hypothetical protein
MTLTTKIYCSRQYILKKYYYSVVKKYGSALGGVRTPWTPPLSTPLAGQQQVDEDSGRESGNSNEIV